MCYLNSLFFYDIIANNNNNNIFNCNPFTLTANVEKKISIFADSKHHALQIRVQKTLKKQLHKNVNMNVQLKQFPNLYV